MLIVQSPELEVCATRNTPQNLGGLRTGSVDVMFVPPPNTTSTQLVNALAVQWSISPHLLFASQYSEPAGVVSVDLVDASDGSVVVVANRSVPVLLTVALPSGSDESWFVCGFWDVVVSGWSSHGLAVVGLYEDESGSVYAVCGTVHLSDFSASVSPSFVSQFNLVDPIGDAGALSHLAEVKSLIVLIAVGVLLCGSAVAVVASWRADAALRDTLIRLQRAHIVKFGEVRPGVENHRLLASASAVQNRALRMNVARWLQRWQQRLLVRVCFMGVSCV